MRFVWIICALFLLVWCNTVRAGEPATMPATAPSGLDAATWQRMKSIDAKAGAIRSLTADFHQKKFTSLLKEPMVSSGTLVAKGSTMVWDTKSSPPTVMRVDEKEIQLYYPEQKTVEIYPVTGQLSSLVSSPIPRLAGLIGRFSFEPVAAKELGAASETDFLALRMTPIDETMKQHAQSVSVLLDCGRGVIVKFNVTDGDGDRTELEFSNITINAEVADSQLQLKLPGDVKRVHPLEKVPQ